MSAEVQSALCGDVLLVQIFLRGYSLPVQLFTVLDFTKYQARQTHLGNRYSIRTYFGQLRRLIHIAV